MRLSARPKDPVPSARASLAIPAASTSKRTRPFGGFHLCEAHPPGSWDGERGKVFWPKPDRFHHRLAVGLIQLETNLVACVEAEGVSNGLWDGQLSLAG